MTGPKGTSPGPWEIRRAGVPFHPLDPCVVAIDAPDWLQFAEVVVRMQDEETGEDLGSKPEGEANAHLIAAAPALYAALACPQNESGGPHRFESYRACLYCNEWARNIEDEQAKALAAARGEGAV